VIDCLQQSGYAAAPALAAGFGQVAHNGGTTEMRHSLDGLSNADIQWHGTRAGFSPELACEKVAQLADIGDVEIPELLALLSDEQAFVAAHLILTRLSGVEYQSFPLWNGLEIDIAPDGTAIVDSAQRIALARRWKRWYDSNPHPAVLPEAD
jgi:hypothetical protein